VTARRALGIALATGVLALAIPGLAQDFATWLKGLRAEAERQGISRATLDAAFANLEPIPRVIELDRRQPEYVLTFPDYLARVASPARIEQGRARLAAHRPLLEGIAAQYGVPAAVVVALWGVESQYGERTGEFPVIGAIATLAFEGRRGAFFRKELLEALRILDQGHVPVAAMRGSWAGAMGQNQFMPSSFLRYAVDHDGDGRRDIWTSLPDVFASTANYLARAGWQRGEPWGAEVSLPPGFDEARTGLDVKAPLTHWVALGVRRADARGLPAMSSSLSVVLPGGPGGAAFVAGDNFRALLRWNRSTHFAAAVGLLADAVERPE
jgi:membrane-bound lytic murein transglycosylase B